VFFARAVLVQEVEGQCARYSTDDESAIIVTKSRDLNIVLPASENGPSIYIDVSPKDIKDVVVATLDNPSQLSPQVDRRVVALSIQISPISESSCYLNAARRHTKSIEIAFDNLDAANRVKTILEADKDLDTEALLVSRSAININVSQANGDEMDGLVVSDDELQALEQLPTTAPPFDDRTTPRRLPEDIIVSRGAEEINISHIHEDDMESSAVPNGYQEASEDLIATASQANALLPPRTTLEQPLRVEPNVDCVQHLQSPSGRGIQEILLNQTLSVQGQEVLRFATNPETALEKRRDEPIRQPEDTSEIGISSVQWQRGRQLIDSASEFNNTLPEPSQQEAAKEHSRLNIDDSPSGHDDEFADLYDASPRALQLEPQPTKSSHERITRRHPTKETKPDASPYRSKKYSSKKLTQRLRNDESEGAAESSAAHPPENMDPVGQEKTPKTLKKSRSNRKLPQSVDNKIERQKQSKRKGKQQNSTSKGTKDTDGTTEAFDQFDIPDSPPESRKHKASRKAVLEASSTKQNPPRKGTKGGDQNPSSTKVLPNTSSLGSARRTEAGNESSSHPGALPIGIPQKRQARYQASGVEAVDWNEDLEVDDEEVKGTSRRKEKKSTKSKPIVAEKGKRPTMAQANSTRKRAMKGKIPPASLSQPRTRRAAALTANKKIQGTAETNKSEKEEQTRAQPLKKDSRTQVTGKEDPSSLSPASHRRLGSVGQKTAPIVNPSTSLDGREPENRAIFAPDMQLDESKLLKSQADPKTSPSDEIFLVNDGETLKDAVKLKMDTVHQDNLGIISHVSENEPLSKNGTLGLVLDETTSPVGLGVLDVGDCHFQDAMAFSAGNSVRDSKSPEHENRRHGPAVDGVSKENQASNLSHDRNRKQELEFIVKTVDMSASNSGRLWASKLTGALSTVPKVVEVRSPRSILGKQNPTQYVPLDSSTVSASKPTIRILKSENNTRADPPTSLAYHADHLRRDGEPIINIIEVVNIKARNVKDQPQEPITNETPAAGVSHISPIVSPSSRASQIPPLKVIQISSGAEDSSDERSMYDPEIANDTAANHIKRAAHSSRAEVNNPRAADTKSQIPAAKMTQLRSATMHEPEQCKREMEILQPKTGKAITNTSSKTRSEGIEPDEHIPDPARKSNLISFSAEGPRNQGIASGQKAQPLGSSDRQDHHSPQPKKLEPPHFEDEDEGMGELPPKDPTPLERPVITQTGSRQAQDLPSGNRERRVGKLTSKLQKPIPITKRNEIPNSFSLMENVLSTEETMNNVKPVAENLSIRPVKASPAVRAKPFAVADVGYNSAGGEANNARDEFSTRPLNVVPVKFPSAAIVQGNRCSSLASSQVVHSTRKETKRHAEDTVVDVLNEVALGKRRKLSSKAFIAEEIAAESVPKQISSVEGERTGGSQSTRVDENGSPLPFTHSRHVDILDSQPRLTQDIVRVPAIARTVRDKEDDLTWPNDKMKLDGTTAPLRKGSRAPKARKIPLEPSGNSKLQLNPPNAPSSIVDEMEPHHIDHTGKFINVETENVITSHEPPDPFLGTTQGQPNKFMQALRRSSHRTHKQLQTGFITANAHIRRSLRMAHHDGDEDGVENDQDVTLVEPESQDEHSQTASQTSSTSSSSHSEEGSPSEKRSVSDDRSGRQDHWRKALQTHQHSTLDVLYDISHVSSPIPFPSYITQP